MLVTQNFKSTSNNQNEIFNSLVEVFAKEDLIFTIEMFDLFWDMNPGLTSTKVSIHSWILINTKQHIALVQIKSESKMTTFNINFRNGTVREDKDLNGEIQETVIEGEIAILNSYDGLVLLNDYYLIFDEDKTNIEKTHSKDFFRLDANSNSFVISSDCTLVQQAQYHSVWNHLCNMEVKKCFVTDFCTLFLLDDNNNLLHISLEYDSPSERTKLSGLIPAEVIHKTDKYCLVLSEDHTDGTNRYYLFNEKYCLRLFSTLNMTIEDGKLKIQSDDKYGSYGFQIPTYYKLSIFEDLDGCINRVRFQEILKNYLITN